MDTNTNSFQRRSMALQPTRITYDDKVRHAQQVLARKREESVQRDQMKEIISRLRLSDASHPKFMKSFALATEFTFLQALWPFPQALSIEVHTYSAELRDKYLQVYDRCKVLYEQYKIMDEIRNGARRERFQFSEVDPSIPNTLGWRGWDWDSSRNLLCSQVQLTPWEGPDIRVPKWDTSEAVRGAHGIHACLMPLDWTKAHPLNTDMPTSQITGVVERFGKYVLGTEGWRAEWVIIRKLLAPTLELGLLIEMAYPDVEVHYFDTQRYVDY